MVGARRPGLRDGGCWLFLERRFVVAGAVAPAGVAAGRRGPRIVRGLVPAAALAGRFLEPVVEHVADRDFGAHRLRDQRCAQTDRSRTDHRDALTRLVSDVDRVQDALLRCALPGAVAVVVGLAAAAVTGFAWPVVVGLLTTVLVIPWVAFRMARRHLRALAPLRQTAELLAAYDRWPPLYDTARLASNSAGGASPSVKNAVPRCTPRSVAGPVMKTEWPAPSHCNSRSPPGRWATIRGPVEPVSAGPSHAPRSTARAAARVAVARSGPDRRCRGVHPGHPGDVEEVAELGQVAVLHAVLDPDVLVLEEMVNIGTLFAFVVVCAAMSCVRRS